MTTASPSAGGGEIRASDAERDDALRSLAGHYADGRIDRAEFDERAEAAFAARTREQLRVLFRDLPQSAADLTPRPSAAASDAHPISPAAPFARPVRPRPGAGVPAPLLLLLVPLLLTLGVAAAVHGIPPFPIVALFFILTRGQRRRTPPHAN